MVSTCLFANELIGVGIFGKLLFWIDNGYNSTLAQMEQLKYNACDIRRCAANARHPKSRLRFDRAESSVGLLQAEHGFSD
jgi:hypothetical protein